MVEHNTSTTSEKPSLLLEGHGGAIQCASWSENHEILCTGSLDRSLKVWDFPARLSDCRCVQTLSGHGGSITAVSCFQHCVLSASTDGTIRCWAPQQGSGLFLHPWLTISQTIRVVPFPGWITTLSCDKVSLPNEVGRVYVGDDSGNVWCYSIRDREGELYLEKKSVLRRQHSLGICSTAFVGKDQILYSSGFDNVFRATNTTSNQVVARYQAEVPTRFVAMDHDRVRRELVMVGQEENAFLWDHQSDHMRLVQSLGCGKVSGVVLYPGGNEFCVSTEQGVLLYRIYRHFRQKEYVGHRGALVGLMTANFHRDLAFNVFSVGQDNTVCRWDGDMVPTRVWKCEKSEFMCACYSSTTDAVCMGLENGRIVVYFRKEGLLQVLSGHKNTVACISIIKYKGKECLVSGDYDGRICMWNIRLTRSKAHQYALMILDCEPEKKEPELLCIAFNEHTERIVVGGNDRVLHVLAIEKENLVAIGELHGHKQAITSVVCDANFAISGSEDGVIHVFDIIGLVALYAFRAHDDTIRDMSMLPDSGFLVTCAYDGRVKVWEYAERRTLIEFPQDAGTQRFCRCSFAFRGDKANLVLAGTTTGKLLVFQLPDQEEEIDS